MDDYISRKDAVEWFMSFIMMDEDNIPADVVVGDLKTAIPAADVEPVRRWIPCGARKPEPETEVLVACNRNGYIFVCPAIYEDGDILKGDSAWNWTEIEAYGLYSEEADDWFIPEGWWESRQFTPDDVYNNPVDCVVTHWQPLPEPPVEDGAEIYVSFADDSDFTGGREL